jgi:hypothetical protein
MRKFAACVALTLSAFTAPAFASGSYSGTSAGTFSNPVLTGSYIATDGSSVFLDNTTTAFVLFVPDAQTMTWGNSSVGASPGFSYLYFTPADYTNVAPGQEFLLGSISYLNGTSDLNTLIFGGQLHIDLGNGITPLDLNLGITTTQNTGISPEVDADFVTFGGAFPLSFNVVEGGFSRLNLYGEIVGDPMIDLVDIQIADGFSDTGFVGEGQPPVPEPASWAMMLIGFGALGAVMRRKAARVAFA